MKIKNEISMKNLDKALKAIPIEIKEKAFNANGVLTFLKGNKIVKLDKNGKETVISGTAAKTVTIKKKKWEI